jgi:hypothetical protein
MIMKLTNEQMKYALNRVIAAIDKWWVEVTNSKKGEFNRYDLRGSNLLTFKDYIEWRYKSSEFKKDYISLFISLSPSFEDAVSIDLNLRKMTNGVYTDYDPFCWFRNNSYGVSVDATTGFYCDSMLWDFITINDINNLVDKISSIVENIREDQSVEETDEEETMNTQNKTSKTDNGLIDRIRSVEVGTMNTQNETKTGDGLEKLQPIEVLNVLITELNNLRLFWPKFFNASIGADPDENGDEVIFNIKSISEGFSIDIQNKGLHVCYLDYCWVGAANADMLNINMLNNNGNSLDYYKGICMRKDTPKLNYWNQDELKAASSSYPYLWEFMSRLYSAIYEAMRNVWIEQHEIEEDLRYTKYNGIISRPIFDPQFLEPGALLQIHANEDLGDDLFLKGYDHNCFVMEHIDHNTGLKVMCIDYRKGNKKATEYVFSVKDVTTGKIEINRVK